mgnify:CR=1 FL=1
MREDFERIRQQISIGTVADYLLQKDGRLYKYPDERTGSIKLYPDSNTFYDFGRACGGDPVKLWSHIRGCDNWTALQEIKKTFELDTPDKQYSKDLIQHQELARQQQKAAEKAAKRAWVRQVDELKQQCSFYQAILDSGHCEPLSWAWCVAKNNLTTAAGKLDLLCDI